MKHRLACVALALLLAGCASGLAPIPPRSTPSPIVLTTALPDVWGILGQTPLHIPTLAPGDPCPVAPDTQVDPSFGDAVGSGPLYLVGLGQQGTVDLNQAADYRNGLYTVLLLAIAPPAYAVDMLMRGRQVDGSNSVLFTLSPGSDLLGQWQLSPDAAGQSETGWLAWNGYIEVPGPGCYGLQIDGAGFSEVVIFRIIQSQAG